MEQRLSLIAEYLFSYYDKPIRMFGCRSVRSDGTLAVRIGTSNRTKGPDRTLEKEIDHLVLAANLLAMDERVQDLFPTSSGSPTLR